MLVSVFYENEPIILDRELSGINCRFINGTVKNRKSCSGYCNYDEHRGCLTDKMIHQHKCIEKACTFFFKQMDCFDECEKNRRKAERKASRKLAVSTEKILAECSEVVKDYEGIKLTRARMQDDGVWEITYAAVCSVDHESMLSKLRNVVNDSINLVKGNYSFDTCVEIVYGENYL